MKWKEKYYENSLILDWYYHTSNFGDYLNKWLIEKISDKEVVHVSSNFNFRNYDVYACIGSILQKRFQYPTKIWGAGAMYPNLTVQNINKVHAVRGPLSRKVLQKQDIDCSDIYGDPAILLPKFYKGNRDVMYSLGVIPHYIDQDAEWIISNKNKDGIKIINILDPIEKVIDDILSCEKIISSSLHGLIAADVYKVPSLWVEFSDKVRGNGFKFKDYYLGINYKIYEPLQLRDINEFSLNRIDKLVRHDIKILDEQIEKLWDACPFKKENYNDCSTNNNSLL